MLLIKILFVSYILTSLSLYPMDWLDEKNDMLYWWDSHSVPVPISDEMLLLKHVSTGSIDLVNKLLAQNIDPNVKDMYKFLTEMKNDSSLYKRLTGEFRTPLTMAVWRGEPDVICALLNAGASVGMRDFQQVTSLHYAVANGNTAVVEMLLGREPTVLFLRAKEATVLHIAVRKQLLDMLEKLFTHGAEVLINQQDKAGETPLLYALAGMNIDIIETLVKKGANVKERDEFGETVLHHACRKGRTELVRDLLRKMIPLNVQNSRGNTALHYALAEGHSTIACELIDAGARVDIENEGGFTCLHYVSRNGSQEMVRMVIERKPSLNKRVLDGGATPLIFAITAGNYDAAILLINAGANVNEKNAEGNTPLMMLLSKEACENGENHNLALLDCLLKAGAEVDKGNDRGETPLAVLLSCRCSNSKNNCTTVLKKLLQKGASLHRVRSILKSPDILTPAARLARFHYLGNILCKK